MTVTMIKQFEGMITGILKPLRIYVEAERERVEKEVTKRVEKELGLDKLNAKKKALDKSLEIVNDKIDAITKKKGSFRNYGCEHDPGSLIGKVITARLIGYSGIVDEFDQLENKFKERLWTSEAPSAVGEMLAQLRKEATKMLPLIKKEIKVVKREAIKGS